MLAEMGQTITCQGWAKSDDRSGPGLMIELNNFQVQFLKGDDPSDYTAVVAAVKQLGLKLEKYKGPVEFLVIDHLDALTEN